MVSSVARELDGRVAVVTGGASGIGRAIVEQYVAEGARVVIADINREQGTELAARLGPAAVFRPVDVADQQQVADLVGFAVDTFGGLHVMVNNAGISGPMFGRFLDDDLAAFHHILGVNLLGVMAGTRYAAARMAGHGGGSIINTTSVGGIQAGRAVMTYRASKAAVIHFTKSAAIDLGEYGIRVNTIAPGSIPTPLLASSANAVTDEAERAAFVASIRARMAASRPLNQEGTPQDVAELATFLASERSRYMTGAVLVLDGGSTAGSTGNSRPDKGHLDHGVRET
jgi:NAD(P)-dependent dehydrogenase (short-subunit alcohol dehydrogenase family)